MTTDLVLPAANESLTAQISVTVVGSPDESANTRSLGSTSVALSAASMSRNSTIAMIGGAVSQSLKFLVIIYIARHFSVAEFGLLSFAIAVNAYMFVISNFGLNVFGARAVAQSGVVAGTLLAEVCCLQAVLAIVGTTLAIALLRYVPGVSKLELCLIACFGLSNLIQAGLFDWAFQGLHRQEISAALNILWQGGWLFLTILGIKLGIGLMSVPGALCLSALLTATIGFVWLRETAQVEDRAQSVPLLGRSWVTLRSAAPLGWGTLLMTFIVWSDTATVRLFKGDQSVGWYAAGNRAALAIAMLGTLYVQGTFPYLSHASVASQVAFEHCFARTYADLAMLFVPGCLWAIYYAKQIILLLFRRADYLAAVPVFRIFQITLLFFVANTLLGTGVLVACRQDRTFRTVLAGTATVFLLLCPFCTWQWGIEGAAAAVLGTQIVSWLWLRYETRELAPCSSLSALRWPLMAGIVVITACSSLHLSLWSGVLVLVFAQFCLLLKRSWEMQGAQTSNA